MLTKSFNTNTSDVPARVAIFAVDLAVEGLGELKRSVN